MKSLRPIRTTNMWPSVSSNMFEDFDKLFGNFMQPARTSNGFDFNPACDVRETPTHFIVEFDVPGVDKKDIKIDLQDNQLTVSGEKQSFSENKEDDQVIRTERSYGSFRRSFTLPLTIDTDKVEANYENGVLEVSIPKAEAAKGRTVEVK